MSTLSRALILSTFVLTIARPVVAQVTSPQSSGRINDFAGVLDAATRQELEALSVAVDAETTAEIAVAPVTSLDGLAVEEYALKLFSAWGIGKKDKDNGVLVVVAPAEREMRIEVGYGLEPILPDGLAGAIVRDDFLPRFRDGNYQAGIVAGVQRIATILRRNQPLSEAERRALEPGWDIWGLLGLVVGLAILGTLGGGGGYLVGTGVGARIVLHLVVGTLIAGAGIWLASKLPNGVLIGESAAVVVFAWLGFRHARRPGAIDRIRGSNQRSTGWVGAPLRDSSAVGDGSSSSSGGFGGGRSGGGGASGRW